MVAVKAHQANAFLEKPDGKISSYLFFGSDPGLVRERAADLANQLAKISKPESEILRLDERDIEAEPDRIAIEMQTLPMFGGGKVLRVAHSRRLSPADLKPLVENPNAASHLIIEAGNLKPSDKIRSLFERSKNAAAVACYADSARDLEGVINRALSESQQTIDMDAREFLVTRLGADRALSVGELEKLVLYTKDKRSITIEDVEAIVGDASELALDNIINAAALGHAKTAVHECARSVASGDSVHAVLAAASRHFHRLEATRAQLESGRSEADSLKQLRPPIHFKQKAAFVSQLHAWRHDHLLTALELIRGATKATRSTSGGLDAIVIERLLIRLAQLAQLSKRAAKSPA